jgi:RNase H-fold protein (predicted Holliday junction resolvase)
MGVAKRVKKGAGLDAAVRKLNAEQSEANWESLASALKKSGIRYYKVAFPSGLNGESDLTKANIVLYDREYAPKYKIPVILRSGNRIEGATRYLIGLEINRKAI